MATLEWYEKKLDAYDELVEKSGNVLLNIAAVVEEYASPDLDPSLKDVLAKLRKLGESMVESAERGWRSDRSRADKSCDM